MKIFSEPPGRLRRATFQRPAPNLESFRMVLHQASCSIFYSFCTSFKQGATLLWDGAAVYTLGFPYSRIHQRLDSPLGPLIVRILVFVLRSAFSQSAVNYTGGPGFRSGLVLPSPLIRITVLLFCSSQPQVITYHRQLISGLRVDPGNHTPQVH